MKTLSANEILDLLESGNLSEIDISDDFYVSYVIQK